ncbi:acyl-CoA thioesterase II [Methylocella silvestris BL2]|uniref:Acyl-CoA thioesterase 2 n=1 Tax=Methylocella silvestris (strain DSM 15510 / CIP 108128 / LMG 27833 / NCIMB 13906 / BL2) TaxID=395965 RepID=B8ENM1_METSB|nr:acyl-CoA thioesterase II [Methylocella silvestris]ACK50807.1 acyl-CoA thioesterase II [Methylocella silvestris BL2]
MTDARKTPSVAKEAQRASASAEAVDELLAILDLETIEQNIFRGRSPQVGWQRVFGGLVVAQALVAASRTAPGRTPHSLHCYFLLPGDPQARIVYEVERLRDGSSFATRRCVAIQHGRPIFSLAASFQIEEEGLEHAFAMPDAPAPESLPSEAEMLETFGAQLPETIRRWFASARPIETRPVDPDRYMRRAPGAPTQNIWLRAAAPLPDDPAIHRAVLAYLSDMTLLDTALIAHGHFVFDSALQVASIDHALWFHRPFRADEWLLYVQDSPNSSGARGLTRGLIYSRDGRLVASAMQEGLMRPR